MTARTARTTDASGVNTTPISPEALDVPDNYRDGMARDEDLFHITPTVLKRRKRAAHAQQAARDVFAIAK